MNRYEEKKVRFLLSIAVAIVVFVFAIVFFRFPDNTLADFRFTVDGEGYATVQGYTGKKKRLEIPADDGNGHEVRYIGNDSFGSHASILKTVILPDTVVSIGERAFADCEGLEKVVLSENLETIGRKAFAGCVYLSDIAFPESLKTIDDEAFDSCIRLGKLYIPAGVVAIGYDAFDACEKLLLDVSDNPLAAEVAQEYHIETGKVNANGLYFSLIVGISAILGVGVWVLYRLVKKQKEKARKQASQ